MNTIQLDSPMECIDNNGFAQFSFHNVFHYSYIHIRSIYIYIYSHHDIELHAWRLTVNRSTGDDFCMNVPCEKSALHSDTSEITKDTIDALKENE